MNSIDLGSLNYLAILAGVIINQVLGAAWYSGLGKPWMAEVGFTQEDLEAIKGTPRQWYPYVVAIVCALVFTSCLAVLTQLTGADSVGGGLTARPPGGQSGSSPRRTPRPTASRTAACACS